MADVQAAHRRHLPGDIAVWFFIFAELAVFGILFIGYGVARSLDPATFLQTLGDYNAACRPGHFDHTALDDCRTEGVTPAKTHWARPIDTPPFYGYALRPGITFTYLGLKVDEQARAHFGGQPSSNLYVAGEMMAGNVLGKGYTAGVGMSIGTAFGRIAGHQAALGALAHKQNQKGAAHANA